MASRRPIFFPDGLLFRMPESIAIATQEHFVHNQTMDVAMSVTEQPEPEVSRIAAAIGEPARARMLYCLMDGRARTGTELAIVAGVTPSTSSVHLHRLKTQRLVRVFAQGKHRYYSLAGEDVAAALEALNVLAGGGHDVFVVTTPNELRAARTCYDHIAGALGVQFHDRFRKLGWLAERSAMDDAYDLTPRGTKALEALGIDVAATRKLRRRFAYPCVDWSERRPHTGGALAAALLNASLKRKWLTRDLDSRALCITKLGRCEMLKQFGLALDAE